VVQHSRRFESSNFKCHFLIKEKLVWGSGIVLLHSSLCVITYCLFCYSGIVVIVSFSNFVGKCCMVLWKGVCVSRSQDSVIKQITLVLIFRYERNLLWIAPLLHQGLLHRRRMQRTKQNHRQ
jgi:hypothetical protein